MSGHGESGGATAQVSRAELLAGLTLALDLGLGQPMEHVLRTTLLASRLADRLGLGDDQRRTVYYAAQLVWVGCIADSHELSAILGDDVEFRARTYDVDMRGLPFLGLALRQAARGPSRVEGVIRAAAIAASPRRRISRLISSHCSSVGSVADHLGAGPDVSGVLAYAFERWDGHGLPAGTVGEDVPIEMAVVHVADVAEVHLRDGGVAGAADVVRARRGTQFSPEVADAFLDDSRGILEGLLERDVWRESLAVAPDPPQPLSGPGGDELLAAMGDLADLRTPFRLGHSRAVAGLAGAAADLLGLPTSEIATVRRAAYVHDLGRVGVSTQIWDQAGPLSQTQRERIRLYPYLTGRVLDRIHGVSSAAAVAVAHQERLDGSGYPNALNGSALSRPQRLLAAADVYRALGEPRPYREALAPEEAAATLRDEARGGRLDPECVDAVLTAAGRRTGARRAWPAGLTGREVEVLRLLARGRPTRDIAATLSVSVKTVRNHVEHVYAKIGASNRIQASLFAISHGLADASSDTTTDER